MNYKQIDLGGDIVIIPVPNNYSDCIELINSDYYRIKGQRASIIKLWFATFRNHSFRYNFWLRLCAYKGLFYPFCKWMLHRIYLKYGIDISPKTLIGYGLFIGHGFGTIINPSAIIGNNVNLSQFSTIGSNEGQAALIGNNVYIGPGVCIVERITIGSDVCIGAGAVVTKDVPKGMTAVGVPAKIIGENRHSNYILNAWHCKNCGI